MFYTLSRAEWPDELDSIIGDHEYTHQVKYEEGIVYDFGVGDATVFHILFSEGPILVGVGACLRPLVFEFIEDSNEAAARFLNHIK